MSLCLQIFFLVFAVVSALRPARLARQLENCGVACGGGWCCAEFESCVSNPSDTVDGGWGCIFQGVSNDDGSPITDEPSNPSALAGEFDSLSYIVSQNSVFISSLTSSLSITSLSISTTTSLPSPGLMTPAVASSTSTTLSAPTSTPGTSTTSAGLSLTFTASSKVSTSSEASLSSISSSSKLGTSRTKASPSSSINATLTPSVVLTSDTIGRYIGNGHAVALMLSFIAAAVLLYFF